MMMLRRTVMAGLAVLAFVVSGCGQTDAEYGQIAKEHPCDNNEPYRCKIQREGEAAEKAAQEIKERQASPAEGG
jgi:outer membrane lipoprotein-sorting protein